MGANSFASFCATKAAACVGGWGVDVRIIRALCVGWAVDMRERLLAAERVKALEWREGLLHVLDQRLLPARETWLALDSAGAVAEAIRRGLI